MKTDDLIGMLAREAGPAPRGVVARRFVPALLLALPAAVLLSLSYYALVPMETFAKIGWWIKLFYVIAMAALALPLVARLGRPASPLRGAALALAGLIVLMFVLGLGEWLVTAPADRLHALMGQSSDHCSVSILMISLPALALGLWAMRGLAPTRPAWAGAVTGLLAGAVGAAGYALACGEVTMAFVAVWYTLGMLMPAAVGALLGPWVLRW